MSDTNAQHRPSGDRDAAGVTVIIPAFGEAPMLRDCLEALLHQTYSEQRVQVVVVDNNESPRYQQLTAAFPNTRLIHEVHPGSYAARNAGIREATGSVIAFTDSDCIPAPDWIERGVARLDADSSVAMVGGKIAQIFSDTSVPPIIEVYQQLRGFRQRDYLERYGFAATANLFTRRSVFDAVGVFDASLKSSGDFEWGQRVRSAKGVQVYDADLIVRHPSRSSLQELRAKVRRQAGGIQDLARKRGRGIRSILREVPFDFFPLHDLAECVTDPRLRRWSDRLRMAGLVVLLRATLGFERLRVQFGGESNRA